MEGGLVWSACSRAKLGLVARRENVPLFFMLLMRDDGCSRIIIKVSLGNVMIYERSFFQTGLVNECSVVG